LAKRRKCGKEEETCSSISLDVSDGREENQRMMHKEWGECTLIARAVDGWNVKFTSGVKKTKEFYVGDKELHSIV
jgi:hypothetical protein